jgi:membrane-bound metal-dependent hydrolase YbcI (DUF457 family)
MSSFIAHGLTGVIAKQCFKTQLPRQKERLLLFLMVCLAVLPDLDVIVFMVFQPAGMVPHRGFSHSLLFAAVAAALALAATRRVFPVSRARLFLIYFSPLLSHLALDYLMGAGPPVPFFAPLSGRGFLFPVKLVPCAFYSTTFGGLLGLISHVPTLLGIGLELFIFIPLAVFLGTSGENETKRFIRKLSLAVSALALLASFYLYNLVLRS